MHKQTIIYALCLTLLLAGCAGREVIGPAAQDPALRGYVTQSQIFPGGPVQNVTRLQGNALLPQHSYRATGRVIVLGDIPPDVNLLVTDGKLHVKGSVHPGARVEADAPVVTRTEFYSDPFYTAGFGTGFGHHRSFYPYGGFGYGYPARHAHTVVEGLRYNDPSPVLIIDGTVADTAQIFSNGRIIVGGREVYNSNRMGVAALP
jgi:hypothetical protein